MASSGCSTTQAAPSELLRGSDQVGRGYSEDLETSAFVKEPREMSSNAIQAAKKVLRARIKSSLKGLDDATLAAQSSAVTDKILAHKDYINAKRLSIYISMPTAELRTDELVKQALRDNKQVFIPYTRPILTKAQRVGLSIEQIRKHDEMEMLRLRDLADFDGLIPNSWGIREFPPDSLPTRENALDPDTAQSLDLILMPGLAFDHQLNRLGHGKGYYDEYLSRCAAFSQRHGLDRPRTIALALDEQIISEEEHGQIPTLDIEDAHSTGHRDIKPDQVVWPEGSLELSSL